MDSQPYRDRMVDRLLLTLAVRSVEVERALRAVPYHEHIPEIWTKSDRGLTPLPWDRHDPTADGLEVIYTGQAIVTKAVRGSATEWFPAIAFFTHMLERLAVENDSRVAVVARPEHQGFIIDVLSHIVGGRGAVVAFRGSDDLGSSLEHFDRILVFAGSDHLTRLMVEALSPDGHLIVPLHHGGWFQLLRVGADGGAHLIGSAGAGLPLLPECGSTPRRVLMPSLSKPAQAPIPDELTFDVALRDFLYFLAYTDPAACLLYSGATRRSNLGIYTSPDNWAAHRSKTHYFVGTPQALEVISDRATRFVDLGCPTIAQYDISFRSADGSRSDLKEEIRLHA